MSVRVRNLRGNGCLFIYELQQGLPISYTSFPIGERLRLAADAPPSPSAAVLPAVTLHTRVPALLSFTLEGGGQEGGGGYEGN